MPISNNHSTQRGPNVLAAILGWIWPGLGHRSLGHRRRGRYLCFGVLFLVFVGLLVGGLDAVDHKNDGLWFIAQVFCGPIVIAFDLATQLIIAPAPIERRATMVGLSHVNEIGTLFIAMAGLMNFVVILDALHAKPLVDIERRDQSESTS
ncbi:hypothetical protein H8D29_03990 [PVC group bacterium]|nr:hypothetical protein [PVC group bacterium]